ncbi:hypothetical protein Tco_1451561 [Tanacetum coccineum]
MAGLEFCSKHNMVAYLEKTDGNTEFHQIMDFLIRSSIYYALTVSPMVSTSFVEQFWTTAKSRTVNNISYIDATVASKPMTISEVTAQAKEIKALKAQGRKSIKSFKGESSVHKDLAFDDLDDFVDDTLDYMETEDDQNEGRTSSVVLEEKESANKEVSTEGPISTDKKDGGTDNTKVSTDRQGKGTADQNKGKSATQTDPTPTSTPTDMCTDKEKTTRKTVKTGQTRTQERKSAQKTGRKLSKLNYGQAFSQLGQT